MKLLGPEAEDFLHPTFRDGAKKTLNPMAVQRKREYACMCVFLRVDRARKRMCMRELCNVEEIDFFWPGYTNDILVLIDALPDMLHCKMKRLMGLNARLLTRCGNM